MWLFVDTILCYALRVEARWIPLDNAAKIYPASSSRRWSALFRVSATLYEDVDPAVLVLALDRTAKRIPLFFMRLKRGVFWYYLEEGKNALRVEPDGCCPCLPLRLSENNGYSLRVLYYKNRISAEFFHVLTDGTGGMVFLKTLVAEYLRIKHGANIPCENGILDCDAAPRAAEARDSFMDHAGVTGTGRNEKRAFHMEGTDSAGFNYLTTAKMPVAALMADAKQSGATLTEYLVTLMIMAVQSLQEARQPRLLRRKPVKINVPVNLRRFFPSETIRNFSAYINPGIDPRLGTHSFEETLNQVVHHIRAQATEKQLSAKFTQNVRDEKNAAVRFTPLFIKNLVLKSAFLAVGDALTSTCLSNLGLQTMPPEMARYVQCLNFILGPLSVNRIACAALSYNGALCFNVTRTIEESDFERTLFCLLVQRGIPVEIESNLSSKAADN